MSRGIPVTTVTELRTEQKHLHNIVANRDHTSVETALLIFLGTAALSIIGAFLTKEFHKNKKEQFIKEKLTKVPCPTCQYFSKSSYLRCAVQPKLTMTDEAVNCTDFIRREK